MASEQWSRLEVEAICHDYVAMLTSELAGVSYNKAVHRKALGPKLNKRSEASIEFKHANISAALIDLGYPYISGYKPRRNYQGLLIEVLVDALQSATRLQEIATSDAEQPITVPEVDDILAVLTAPPKPLAKPSSVKEPSLHLAHANYLEREARNRSLGSAGEEFALNFEIARLVASGKEHLAAQVEHTSRVRGDGAGYDILSFEDNGSERLVEVKTTKYGIETPFWVSSNEVRVSERHAAQYHIYRLFSFRAAPQLYTLHGSIRATCAVFPSTYLARPN